MFQFHPWIKIVKGTKIPTKDHEEELLNINIFAPQCKNINIDLGASNPSLGNGNINLYVHTRNDVNQGDSPKGSSDEKSYINVKEIKVPKNGSSLDLEIFYPQKGRVIFD